MNFVPYYKREAQNLLEKIYGWVPYEQKHFESRFTKFLEGYWLPSRFNYDMRRNQFSSLILTDQMERSQALELLESKSFNEKNIHNEKRFIADKLEISIDELEKYHKMGLKYFGIIKIKRVYLILEKKF